MRKLVLLVTAFYLAGALTTRAEDTNISPALTIGTAQVHAYANKMELIGKYQLKILSKPKGTKAGRQ